MLQQNQQTKGITPEQDLLLSGDKIPLPLPQAKRQLEAWGLTFGDTIPGTQPTLVAIKLPNLWKVLPSVVRPDQVQICDELNLLRATIDYRVAPNNEEGSLVAINWEHREATQRSVIASPSDRRL